jgi:hypothetical protein
MSDEINSPVLHPNQRFVASELGVETAEHKSIALTISAIEDRLGDAAAVESSRWFAISVLRHLKKAKWNTLNESGLDEAKQKSLAEDCLAIKGFATSLRTVTKDDRSKYRIVGFASSKNVDRGLLATGTKAYKIACNVLLDSGLLAQDEGRVKSANDSAENASETKTASAKSKRPDLRAAEKTVAAPSSKRPGYSDDESVAVAETNAAFADANQALSMTEEEFADLDAALRKNDAHIVQQSWADQRNEDRWSRILGVLAGVGFFVFVALLFL